MVVLPPRRIVSIVELLEHDRHRYSSDSGVSWHMRGAESCQRNENWLQLQHTDKVTESGAWTHAVYRRQQARFAVWMKLSICARARALENCLSVRLRTQVT
eukprot:gnl/TRDRNA2_/TRDRNA2_131420_c0_seq1.p1 gnl/TRDRNA2_/TRDRNA2_131420_c0~~gnl/TRDRNA2_/TRDRNA2_131420_c0_seq1.p1  ORF type:complete len:101 (+),score=1.20 gnl/TRDRNA2_/TRDRNA2_131420_c0_seq1:179-481(+)